MTEHIQEILKRTEGKKVGIFVDEANLFYSQKTLGWRIDWRRTMMFFERYCSVSMSRYYMGMPPPPGAAYEKNVITKARLDKIGFSVVTKPLKKIFTNTAKTDFLYKCNFDVEIARDVIRNEEIFDIVLLVSSDSDFVGLRNDMLGRKKGFIFLCFEQNAAWEIRRSVHIFFEDIKDDVQYIKNPEKNSG